MIKLVIFVLPLIVLIIPFSASSPLDSDATENSPVKRAWEDQVAEDLQVQIDRLRKDVRDVTNKLNNASSKDRIAELHNELNDMKKRLEDNYLRIDQLAKNLREEYRQKFDTVQKEMNKLQDSLTDRVTSLEDRVQNLAILQVIGAIQDGNVNFAAKTFKGVSYPELVIPRVIKEAYKRNDEKYCKNILAFVDVLELLNERPQALDLLLEEIRDHNEVYSQSDCVFGIAYQTRQLLKVISYGDPLGYLFSVRRQLPVAAHLLNTFNGFLYVTRESKGCKFNSDNDKDKYIRDGHLGDLTKWEVEPQSGGEFYRFKHRQSGSMLEADSIGRVYLGSPYNNGPKQQWKPILQSNERVALRNEETKKFLSFESLSSCYKYSQADKATPVYIHL